jgi:hypothetical protein
VFQHVLNEVDKGSAQRLDGEVRRVMALVNDVTADRGAISRAAASCAEVIDGIAQRMVSAQFDSAMTRRLMKSIAADSDRIANQGERAAEQAAMAIDSLYIASKGQGRAGNEAQIRGAINSLFQLLQNPSNFNPSAFSRQMKAVDALL